MTGTSEQYDSIINNCKDIFLKKNSDYGTSWRIMRIGSILDQIYIKASRIRTIEENGLMKIDEGVDGEYMGIINYCIIGLIQIELGSSKDIDMPLDKIFPHYEKFSKEAKSLMEHKNHDYGEIWRDMLISTFTDIILMRVHRIRQILENKGETIASEGVESNLFDMINYSVFALIRLKEKAIL